MLTINVDMHDMKDFKTGDLLVFNAEKNCVSPLKRSDLLKSITGELAQHEAKIKNMLCELEKIQKFAQSIAEIMGGVK